MNKEKGLKSQPMQETMTQKGFKVAGSAEGAMTLGKTTNDFIAHLGARLGRAEILAHL